MAAFEVDTSQYLGGQIAKAVRELREAHDTIETLSELFTEMDDDTILINKTGFTGTAAQLRSTFSAAVTALENVNLTALEEKLYW